MTAQLPAGRQLAVIAELLEEWDLTPDGSDVGGRSVVLPVRTEDGQACVLKVAPDDDGSDDARQALQRWAGRGAVRMLRADPYRRALLLERLRPTDLTGLDEIDACEIVGGLYERLQVLAGPRLPRLSTQLDVQLGSLARLPRDAPIPHRLVEHALSAGRDLRADPSVDGLVIHGDLHLGHVLAGDRERWLAISPRPLSGHPCWEVAPLLWNGWSALVASGDVRWALRQRFETVVDAAGLDEDRARDGVVVRTVIDACRTISSAALAGRALEPSERDWITRCVTIIKAVQA